MSASGFSQFPQYLWMPFGHLEQGLSRAAGLAPTLLPLLQRAYRHAQERGELSLRQT